MSGELVKAHGLVKHFPVRGSMFSRSTKVVHAVEDVDLSIDAAETVGIVGESGSGKSTLGRLLLGLLPPTAGYVEFDGTDLTKLSRADLRRQRRHMQIVFQDPYASLNPRMRVGSIIGEGPLVHSMAAGSELKDRVLDIMERVGLPRAAYDRYPHEFSGGQRQRIGIARALAVEPRFLVADEPVSALDVSVGAQILNLLAELRAERDIAMAFISHDLRVVEHTSDRVAVMYLGRIVELAPARAIYDDPQHPYTKALLSAVPDIDLTKRRERIVLGGEVPSPIDPPSGCPFHPRCAIAVDRCKTERPQLVVRGGHGTACHLTD
ncbi:MAG: oligopeptide/dipeptide ABC transporter ATP-binding protein [Hyphomicrobiaceae bacterium]|jgi:oligopeptide/dipeptide ABC transporter ATP-binding protein